MKSRFWKKTYWMILVVFFVFLIITIAAFSGIVYLNTMNAEKSAAQTEAQNLALYDEKMLSAVLRDAEEQENADDTLRNVMLFTVWNVSVNKCKNRGDQLEIQKEGKAVSYTLAGDKDVYDLSTFEGEHIEIGDDPTIETLDGVRYVFTQNEDQSLGVTYLYGRSLAAADRSFGQLVLTSGFSAFGILALFALILYFIMRRLSRPLQNLRNTTERIAAGDYDAKAPVVGKDEFALLAIAFNDMTAKIDSQMTQLKESADEKQRLVDNMAHELRTPLTTICAGADMLRRTKISEEQKTDILISIENEGKRLKRISEILLDRAYIGANGVKMSEVPLLSLLDETLGRLHIPAEKAGVKLSLKGEETVVNGNDILLGLLFSNLIENAIKACSVGGKVEVTIEKTNDKIAVHVRDNGKGMTEEQLSHLTEPFYRVDKSRSRAEGGAGLGLTLCKTIAESHGAELLFKSEENKGTCATVVFPVSFTIL